MNDRGPVVPVQSPLRVQPTPDQVRVSAQVMVRHMDQVSPAL